MIARLLAAVAVAAPLLSPRAALAQGVPQLQPQPLRLASGVQLWTIPDAALQQFARTGTFSDQHLLRLVAVSGWPDDALRAALLKPYAVDLAALARFLDSPAGEAFLQEQTRAYRERNLRVPALRSAILAEAQGGTLSALGILRHLPVPLVLDLSGPSPRRCSALPCDSPEQCRSLLSWLVFLPACLQAAAAQG